MKNWKITVLALFGSVIALAACGQAQTEVQKAADARPETQTAAQTGGTAAAENTEAAKQTDAAAPKNDAKRSGVDVLITPNNTANKQVTALLEHPEESIGKTVQLIGEFDAYYIENTGYLYIACEVPDPTTCCVPGIEFELDGAVYPDDYPEVGSVITVTGTFDIYERDGASFGILRGASMEQ